MCPISAGQAAAGMQRQGQACGSPIDSGKRNAYNVDIKQERVNTMFSGRFCIDPALHKHVRQNIVWSPIR